MDAIEALAIALCEKDAQETVDEEEDLGWAAMAMSAEKLEAWRQDKDAKVRAFWAIRLNERQRESYRWLARKLSTRVTELMGGR